MRFKFLFLFLFLKTAFLFSQTEYEESVDSLQVLINNEKKEVNTIKHYKALCEIYKKYDVLKFNMFNEQLSQIVKKTKQTKELGFYYSNKAEIFSTNNNFSQALVHIAKANDLFYKYKDWDNYILSSCKLAIYLSINEKNANAKKLLRNTLNLAITRKSRNIAYVYLSLSYCYNSNSNYVEALQFAKKSLLFEKNNKRIIQTYGLISQIHNSLGNYKKALEYNSLVTESALITNQKLFFHNATNAKSIILFDTQQYKEALKITIDNLRYYKDNNYIHNYYACLYYISRCYYKLKKYDLAEFYIDERIKIGFNRRNVEIDCKAVKAQIYLAINDLKTAEKYIDYSLSLLKEDDFYEMKLGVYKIKEELEEKQNNYKEAFYFSKKIAAIKDANTANFNKNKIQQLQVDLDVTEKNNRIKNLQITQLQKQTEITTKNKYLIYFFCALLVCVFGLILFLYTFNIIKIKNSIIESKNLKLEEKSNKIQKSLQEKETLLKEIHHRVKNNLQLVMSLLNIQAQKTNQNVAGFLAVSKSRILSMALIHENLYQSENLNEVNFKEYTENLTQTILNAFETQNTTIALQIEMDEVHFDIQTAIPLGLIINELINNAYKHAFVNQPTGIITLKLTQKETNYELLISDDGVGIPKKEASKKTLGLKLVEELVFQIDGKLSIQNNNGMHYLITFQNNKLITSYE
ncbi:sensor histidine kinase [Flavobacterium sp.]|uniref:tetratricopeptide repeat-containing sensor histidine kinase n=1 Tax=Flavobacterium sp. TaxID=239 RepID=UPI00286E55F7|nr:sensor histidine kinase [Flavobacterium sp.]